MELLKSFVDSYPWVVFIAIWLFWVASVLIEYRWNRNRQLAAGGLLFLFCFLAYAVSTIESLGIYRWVLVGTVLVIGFISIRLIMRRKESAPPQVNPLQSKRPGTNN